MSPIFDKAQNYLSVTFLLNNFEEGLNEDFGYLRLIGANVSTEWLDKGCLEGQIHIPIKPD